MASDLRRKGYNAGVSRQTMKYLTFSFDDGFIESARVVDRILGKDKATFFLTTGWVLPNTVPILDPLNVGATTGRSRTGPP
jgi:hypothetical protein